jgi:hypothetical protein
MPIPAKKTTPNNIEPFGKVVHSVITAKAGIHNRLNPALSGAGFRVALRLPGMSIFTGFKSLARASIDILFIFNSFQEARGVGYASIGTGVMMRFPLAFPYPPPAIILIAG